MTKIITTKNHIVFDGHADSVQECETITLLANALAESEKFKTIKYESGYAEFEKVGKAKELKFAPAEITVIFDSHITKVVYHGSSDVEFSTSGEQKMTSALDGTEYLFTVTLETGYILDTVTLSNADTNMGTLVDKTDTTFTILASVGGISQTITLTSKQSTPTYPKINSFTYHGKKINNINGKPIRYVHHSGNTYEMVYVVQLATPQNVTANGTTLSWDEVENATSYEIYADGVSIGTVEKAPVQHGYAVTITKSITMTRESEAYYSLDNGATYIEIPCTADDLVLNGVTQIKFKTTYYETSVYNGSTKICGYSGTVGDYGPYYSENIILSGDATFTVEWSD